MYDPRTFSDKFFLVIKGLCMGAANKVPGVSGGIVAFVGGFYEEFIYSLQKINRKAFKLLFNGRFKSFYQYVNGTFLTLLVFGMLISYFSVSQLLDYFLAKKELFVWAAFFGMILGSIYYISKDFEHWNKKTVMAGLIGLMVGISISFLNPAKENDNLFFVFLCGIISVSGMTLPGLSGSFILILLGNYVLLLVDSVNALYDTIAEVLRGDLSFTQNEERLNILIILAVFTAGSATGLVSLSHLLGYVLKRYQTYHHSGDHRFYHGIAGGGVAVESDYIQDRPVRQNAARFNGKGDNCQLRTLFSRFRHHGKLVGPFLRGARNCSSFMAGLVRETEKEMVAGGGGNQQYRNKYDAEPDLLILGDGNFIVS